MEVNLKTKTIRVLAVERRALERAHEILRDYQLCREALMNPCQAAFDARQQIDLVQEQIDEQDDAKAEQEFAEATTEK